MGMRMLGPGFPVFGLAVFLASSDSMTGPLEKPHVEGGRGQSQVQAVLKEPFSLSFGETALLKEELLSVGFLGVLEDTRCPIDTVCIQAGNARISIQAEQKGREARTLELTLTDDPRRAVYEGFSVHVEELAPARKSEGTILDQDYSIRLVVNRVEAPAPPRKSGGDILPKANSIPLVVDRP